MEENLIEEKPRRRWGWLIAVFVLILIGAIGWLILNNVYVDYYSETLADPDIYCESNVLKENGEELTSLRKGTIAEIFCKQYPDSKYLIYCDENTPIIECQTTLFKLYFSR